METAPLIKLPSFFLNCGIEGYGMVEPPA